MKIIRSRNEEVLNKSELLLDVGGEFDGDLNFDHHQKGFDKEVANEFNWQSTWGGEIPFPVGTHNGVFHADEVFAISLLKVANTYNFNSSEKGDLKFKCKPSSAGLILKKLEVEGMLPPALVNDLYLKVIKGIDARDNGIDTLEGGAYSISDAISNFNTNWDSEDSKEEAFNKALNFAIGTLEREVETFLSKKKAFSMIEEKVESAFEKGERFIVLDKFVPWKEHINSLDKEGVILFVVAPSSSKGWGVTAVPPEANSFQQLKSFPEHWAVGNETDIINKDLGVDDTMFSHTSRFFGVWESKKSALKGVDFLVNY